MRSVGKAGRHTRQFRPVFGTGSESLETRCVPAYVSISQSLVATAGGSAITVPFLLHTEANEPISFSTADVHIKFDASKFTISNVQPGTIGGSYFDLSATSCPASRRATGPP